MAKSDPESGPIGPLLPDQAEPAGLTSPKRPALWGFLVAVVVGLASLGSPNLYLSRASILPVEAKGLGGLGGLSAAAAAFGMSLPSGEGGDANYIDILNSRPLREHLLNTEFTFHFRSWRFGAEQTRTETLATYLKEKNPDRGVRRLASVMGATRDLKSKIITITAETNSPDLSQQIVQKATGYLENFVQERGRTRGGFKAAFAEARLQDSKREAKQMEEELLQFLSANRNYLTSLDPSVRIRGQRLETEYKLRQQLIMTLSMNREQALLEEKNDIPILNVLDPGNLPIDKSRPNRSFNALIVFLVVTSTLWSWRNRKWIVERILGSDDSEPGSQRAEQAQP